MSKEFKMTDPGEGLQEAEILEVHVAAGDTVEDGDTVLTVETDKASTDIPAPFSGTIEEVRVSEGDTIEVGGVLMTYDDSEQAGDGEESTDEADDDAQDDDEEQSEDNANGDENNDAADDKEGDDEGKGEDEDEDGDGDEKDGDEDKDKDKDKDKDDSDAEAESDNDSDDDDERDEQDEQDEQQPAHEKNVEMGDIEDDDSEEENTDSDDAEDDDASADEQDDSAAQSNDDEPVPAAPSTRRLAREKNVNLRDIEPSGKQGRVTAEDVEAAAQSGDGSGKRAQQQAQSGKDTAGGNVLIPGGGPAPALPDFSQWGEVERVSLRSIKRATAKNMARSWGQIPHVYHQDVADVTALDRFRREHEDAAEIEGGKFTLTVLVMKALASALAQFPRFNASLDVENQEVVVKHYCHIGLAVATDRGLLVPVIRDVDQKNLVELTAEATDIARKTRNGEVKRADMQGGSITVTNPGAMGGSSLTPLINHPQVAILGMAQARLQPTVQGDLANYTIEPRLCLPLVLGFDHRVNDGAEAAQFVTHLKNTLADPESLLLNI